MTAPFKESCDLSFSWQEESRVAALRRYGILDTPPEPEFDGIARIAGLVCEAPVAAVNLIDTHRQWSKAKIGLDARELPRPLSICAYTIQQPDLFVVPDITKDERFNGSPLVTGEPRLRFYAGVPIRTSDGFPLGTVCVLDFVPRPAGLTSAEADTLRTLALQVVTQLEHRRTLQALARHEEELAERERRFRTLADAMPQMVWSTRPDGYHDYFNRRWYEFTGMPEGSTDGHGWAGVVHPDDRERTWTGWRRSLETGESFEVEDRMRHHSGEYRWTLTRALPIRNERGEIERWFGTSTDIHGHRLAEDALRESEARYRALVEASAAIVWRSAPDGAILEGWGWEDYCGQGPDAFMGHGWLEAVHPEDVEQVISRWQQILASGQAGTNEFRARHLSGTYRWVLARGVPFRGEDGTVREWVGTITDIHDQKTSAERLRESEERFRTLTEAMPALVFSCDREGRNDYINPAYQAYTGLPAGDLLGHRWLEVVHPDDRVRAAEKWVQAPQQGAAYEFENRLRRADGSYRWFIGRAAPLRNSAGGVVRWLGACIDIHDRRASEAALARSEERLRLLAAHSSDMIARSNLDGLRHYVSPAALEITGYKPEELMGTSCSEFCHPDDLSALTSKVETLVRGDLDHATLSYRLRRKDGTWTPVEAKVRLVRAADGAPEALVSVTRDISERQQLEAQLRQAQKMEAMGALTGGVAHDFNNLLTVILGNAELLADDLEDATLQSLARMIQNAAETGADLTQRLLAFARRQSLELEAVRVEEVLGGMTGLLRRTIGEHIELRTAFAASSATLVDKSLLESAILNLVVNAKDAMPQGGTLTIATGEGIAVPRDGNLPAGQPVVFITIADTGTGMPPEVIDRVFEPFFTTKEVGKGTGLGLSMVYGFAQQSGGHVRIESQVGEGTAVTILLRAVTGNLAHAGEAAAPAPIRRGQGRVLLVEDEPSVRVFMRTQLESLGYDVTDVGDGPSALELLRMGASFDLLLSDVVLPKGMSGVEIARETQTLNPSIRVLLTSGYSEEVFKEHGRPKGDIPLLRKPFRRRELAEAIRQALG